MKKIRSITYCSPRSVIDVRGLSGNFPVLCKDLELVVGTNVDFLVELSASRAVFRIVYEDGGEIDIDVSAAYKAKHLFEDGSDEHLSLQALYI